jgi:hypothetical protein
MDVSKTNDSSKNDPNLPKGKFGHSTRQVSASVHNHIHELDKYVSCGNHVATAGTPKVFCDVASGIKAELAFGHLQKVKRLPQSQSKDQDQENTISGSSTLLNQRTLNQRKKAWKEEKKRVREEEARRRMLAPKGQRVRLVNQQMLGMLVNSNTKNVPVSTCQSTAPAMNEIEFPTVEESKKHRLKLNEDFFSGVRGDVRQERSCNTKVQVKLNNLGSNNSCCVKSSNTEDEVIAPRNSMPARNKKRKDPIQIDLVNLIKVGVCLMCPY